MDALLVRSNSMNSTFALLFWLLMLLMSCSAVYPFLAPMMTLHPSLLSSFTVSAPMPEFPPVTTAYFPERSVSGMLKTPPLKYFFKRARTIRMGTAYMRIQVSVHDYCIFEVIISSDTGMVMI